MRVNHFRPINPSSLLRLGLSCALLASAAGCGGDGDAFRLTWADRAVLPYEGDERLVFGTAAGAYDTIQLEGYEERLVSPPVAGALGNRQYEEYRLRAERFDERVRRVALQDDAVKVYRHTAGQTLIRFALDTRGAALFRIMPLAEFRALPDTLFTAFAKTYRDVKVVPKDSLLEGKDAFAADRFYWSADAGFVGYERAGEVWRLVEVE